MELIIPMHSQWTLLHSVWLKLQQKTAFWNIKTKTQPMFLLLFQVVFLLLLLLMHVGHMVRSEVWLHELITSALYTCKYPYNGWYLHKVQVVEHDQFILVYTYQESELVISALVFFNKRDFFSCGDLRLIVLLSHYLLQPAGYVLFFFFTRVLMLISCSCALMWVHLHEVIGFCFSKEFHFPLYFFNHNEMLN